MQIKEYFTLGENEKQDYLSQIKESDWSAGQYLYELLKSESLKKLCGEKTEVLLLVDEGKLISFCTFAEHDDIKNTTLTPWVGFVYTFPNFRGKRRIGKLLEYAYYLAKQNGDTHIYISTNEKGLYEKYNYTFFKIMKDIDNKDSSVYVTDVCTKDFSKIIGTKVSGIIDRPLGSHHPRKNEIIYSINYGYVKGVFAADGSEQDVYVFGTDKPLETYTGNVIAVYHRFNDVEDKWIVSLDDRDYSDEEILSNINFIEQFFMGELCRK